MIFKSLFGRKDPDAVAVGGSKELLTLSRRLSVPAQRAFAVFVDGIDTWWPRDRTWAGANLDRMVIEPRFGGRALERSKDGSTAVWGTVLSFSRPHHIVIAWQIDADRRPEASEATSSRVDVRFSDLSAGGSELLLVHRDFFRHGGEGWENYRNDMAGKKGWPELIALYAKAAEAPG